MTNPRLNSRYRRLMAFFAGLTLRLALWDVLLPLLGLRSLSRRTRRGRYRRIAVEFRALAIQMGGVMIKMGQFLSARLDVLPSEITEELAGLQDEVPPEDFEAIRRLAEAELGAPLEEVFEHFDKIPMAAASLGQVHRARLSSNSPESDQYLDVVVKIQRPMIAEIIDVDFAALRRFGGWVRRYGPIRRRIDVLALIQELSDTVHREIDYLAEAQNAVTFGANFAKRTRVRVPRVVWSRTTAHVLTLEDVFAIKITDYAEIQAAGVSRARVAKVLFKTYLQQIFEDHFFHADPHPGNLFVSPVPAADPEVTPDWRLTFVDFGMVGTVPQDLQRGLRDMAVGIGTRNAARVVAAYQTLGMLLPGANLEVLEQAEGRLFERFWGMSMRELRNISHAQMHEFALEFREVMYSMPFQIPHNLLLLGRALAILSGMCTGLDPDFNVWDQLSPYAQKLIAGEQASSGAAWLDQIGELAKELIALPGQTSRILTRLEHGDFQVRNSQLDRQMSRLEGGLNRLAAVVVFAAFLLSGVLLFQSGDSVLAYVFWGLSGISLILGAARLGYRRP